MRSESTIQPSEICGSTADGQPVVHSGKQANAARAEPAGIRYATAGTGATDADGSYWQDRDGSIGSNDHLRASTETRLRAIQNDGAHPAAPYYEYNTAGSTEARNGRRRSDYIQLTYNRFNDVLPPHVDSTAVKRVASRIDGEGTGPSGGLSFVAVSAIVAVWGPSDEEIIEASDFRARFREEFADAQKSSSQIFREMLTTAREVGE